MSCGAGRKQGLYSALLWLWCRLAATAPIPLLAWELPFATGAALKRKKIHDKLFWLVFKPLLDLHKNRLYSL